MMAASKVLMLADTLVPIFLQLSPSDILSLQTVCKKWDDCIKGTESLKQALFLAPARRKRIWLVAVLNLPSGQGPLPRRYQTRLRVKAEVRVGSAEHEAHAGLTVTPVYLNELCCMKLDGWFDTDFAANVGDKIQLHPETYMYTRPGNVVDSCREMFLTQPPVRSVTLQVEVSTPGLGEDEVDKSVHILKIASIEGIKVKEIADEIEAVETKVGGTSHWHVIFPHGDMTVSDKIEEVVKARTKQWEEENKMSIE